MVLWADFTGNICPEVQPPQRALALAGASQVPVGVAQHAPPVPGLIPQLAGVAVAEPPPEGAEQGPREPELPPPPPRPLGGEDALGTMTEANASNFSIWAAGN